jgi:hypothetical protein
MSMMMVVAEQYVVTILGMRGDKSDTVTMIA